MRFYETCIVDTEGFFKFKYNDKTYTYKVSNKLEKYKVSNTPIHISDSEWNDWENQSQMTYVIVKFVSGEFVFYDENCIDISSFIEPK